MNSQLTVFVVDDEKIVRDFFATSFPWQSLDMRWIGDAGDGLNALERCRELQPDLLLVDVTMPGINGIEVLARVSQEMPYVNTVLLTCHQEFSYVQAALRLGALDYLVKAATTPDELVGKLAQVRNRVIAKRTKARLSTMQRELLAQLLYSGTQQRITAKARELESEMLRLRFPLANAPCAVLWVLLQRKDAEREPYLEHADIHDDPQARQLLDSLSAATTQVMWIEPRVRGVEANQYAIVANTVDDNPLAQLHSLRELLQEITGEKYTVVAGASGVAPDLFHLQAALKQARHAFSARFYSENALFFHPQTDWMSLAPEFQSDLEEMARTSHLQGGEFYGQVEALVASAIAVCCEQNVDPEMAKLIVLHLIQILMEEYGCRVSKWERAVWPMQLDRIDTESHLRQWALHMVSLALAQSKTSAIRPEIKKVLVRLNEQLADPWDVTLMAEVAGMHPNYFGTVFKVEIGQAPSEYLAHLRMNRAAQYLQEGVWSMQQVANMVGINNYRTFYNTFCRIMGTNPKDFSDKLSRLVVQ